MPELYLQRNGSSLDTILGEYKSSFPLTDVALNATTWEYIYDDAAAYGRDLFNKTFRDEQMQTLLTNLPANERLLLVADDPLVAAIPWEYLRDQSNKLLASRLNFVRGIPEAQRRESFTFTGRLEIVTIPISPVDEPRVLNVEREWKNLVEAVSTTTPPKSLTLKRVRPPTRSQLERSLDHQCTSIVHFMGHSTSHAGKAFLAFEDARARKHLVDAADFADSLNSRIFLVVLNSCLSAIVAATEFGNIARALVQHGVPYALGMQFILPDDAALVLSDALYDFLLQGHRVEEAVMRTRRALEEPGKLHNPTWLAGIPVLYSSLRTPTPPIELTTGQPIIQPDPEQLEQTCDLTALPQTEHFLGRGDQVSEVLGILLAPHRHGFVLLHGLGGIGKTALARAIAERVGWNYGDRVLAYSFETFARLDANNQRVVDETFADRFYNCLACFYELDPIDSKLYPTAAALQQAILQRRVHVRSLLVLDNMETLIDAQRQGHPAAKTLATFISRLKEGNGAILLTSRIVPPSDWGRCEVVDVPGLVDDAGADLFLALLPADREHLAPPAARLALSQRVQGHPLSIRLLASRFAEDITNLVTFLKNIKAELEQAEQATPASLEDPDRQRTLYACMDYSIRRLTPEQRKVLDTVSLFQAPFPPEFAMHILEDDEQIPVHLQNLVRLGLLNRKTMIFKEGELVLLDLHPMLRWYIQYHLSALDTTLQERYGEVYEHLAQQAYQEYDQNALIRYLVRQSLPDCEAALHYLPPASRIALAYCLAKPYERLGQYQRALVLYEWVLEVCQELGDIKVLPMTQFAIARVLRQQGKLQEAMMLYEQALQASQVLGDMRKAGIIQHAIAEGLVKQGKLQEAMMLYERSLQTSQAMGDVRGMAATQFAIADGLKQQGKLQEAMMLYKQALQAFQAQGDMRAVAMTQFAMASVLRQESKPQEAMVLYEQALQGFQALGDVPEVAVVQQEMASALRQLGKAQEAIVLYEQSLRTLRELGNMREVAVTQANFCRLLFQEGKYHRALSMAWDAYTRMSQANFSHDAEMIQQLLMSIKGQFLSPVQFDIIWEEAIDEPQPDWLQGVQVSPSNEQDHLPFEILKGVVVNTVTVMTVLQEKRDEWCKTVAGALKQAQSAKRQQDAEFLAAVLALLDGQASSLPEDHLYASEFAAIQAGIAAGGLQDNDLPFGAELIPRSISALLGGPQEKIAHMQYLTEQMDKVTNEELKALLQVIQLALFSPDLSQLGRDLSGVYRQAWETISASAEAGGVDPRIFEIMINNTLAVLGPASDQRSEWRNNLVTMRNQATTHGDRNLMVLLDAVISLLDAGGNPAGLGEGLKGIYAKTWLAIIERLMK